MDIDLTCASIALDEIIKKYIFTQEFYKCEGEGIEIDWSNVI